MPFPSSLPRTIPPRTTHSAFPSSPPAPPPSNIPVPARSAAHEPPFSSCARTRGKRRETGEATEVRRGGGVKGGQGRKRGRQKGGLVLWWRWWGWSSWAGQGAGPQYAPNERAGSGVKGSGERALSSPLTPSLSLLVAQSNTPLAHAAVSIGRSDLFLFLLLGLGCAPRREHEAPRGGGRLAVS